MSETSPQVLAGPCALAEFRERRLLEEGRKICPDLAGLRATYLHYLTPEVRGEALSKAQSLLQYGASPRGVAAEASFFCLVLPREGTISPWSSKATDVFNTSGLTSVRRVERGVRWDIVGTADQGLLPLLHDRMTTRVSFAEDDHPFAKPSIAEPLQVIDFADDGLGALQRVNLSLGLALSEAEVRYLHSLFDRAGRHPTDAELMMFAQVNSEHCRHKIFNAEWRGAQDPRSLFDMIRHTSNVAKRSGVLSAYKDNAAVIQGHRVRALDLDADSRVYGHRERFAHILMKAETHNHPTAIAPFEGAATGSGGEIRDEACVGRGSKPKASFAGFTTSHLRIPGNPTPWEATADGNARSFPSHLASALDIMLEGPIGAASYNNEYGRPALAGYFRTFEHDTDLDHAWGYHKPVMIAGGLGAVREEHVQALPYASDSLLIVLGGPALHIGIGGGAASSAAAGAQDEALDFQSVQRDNAEMQRRCQEVIDRCAALRKDNPIQRIHDVGAGGLSNALPELLKDGDVGGRIELDKVLCDDQTMGPMAVWCNESQERYVISVSAERLETLRGLCERERCPFAVVGRITPDEKRLRVVAESAEVPVVDMAMEDLFGEPPRTTKVYAASSPATGEPVPETTVSEALDRVLAHPSVACKSFLVTIGDRSITGLVARDQMVGPWQVPVADAACTLADFHGFAGEALAVGERSPIAMLNPAASARMAVAEALTNLASAGYGELNRVVLSANWMAASGVPSQDAALYEAVCAVGLEFCPKLGVAIPVGKDSLSMKSTWRDVRERSATSPLTLVVSAFAPLGDARRARTPELRTDLGDSQLWLIELGGRPRRLGASILGQCYGALGEAPPDIDDALEFRKLLDFVQRALSLGLITAMHDRSDGGLLTTLLEMCFAGRCGARLEYAEAVDSDADADLIAWLFNEEVGMLVQVLEEDVPDFVACAREFAAADSISLVGVPRGEQKVSVHAAGRLVFSGGRAELERRWRATSHAMQLLRDDPQCADEELAMIDEDSARLNPRIGFELGEAPNVGTGKRPRIAILREQGVNGQIEMAAAFDRAGFEAVDLHMTDLLAGRDHLDNYQALAACGGFSYGDVLGAGGGWAKSILFHNQLKDAFTEWLARDRLVLGVCNGCQMFAHLAEIVPGARHWPTFLRNRSEQFEARLIQVRIEASASPWLQEMQGSVLPVVVAHGEGRAAFGAEEDHASLATAGGVAMRYVNGAHQATMNYPANPNGSLEGVAGVTNADGRVLLLMPHPERIIRAVQHSWCPDDWHGDGPWMKLFHNAHKALK